MIRTTLIAFGLALVASTAAMATPLNALEAKCAAEAASKFEPGFEISGLDLNEIDPQRAVDTCWAAMGSGENDFRMSAWIARAYYAAGQYGDAFQFAERAAGEGVALGIYLAGVMYSKGEGVALDGGRGIDLLTASAEAGFVPAYHALAVNLINGTGVDAQPEMAVGLLQFAADEGYGPAATTLGYMYYDGVGVTQDDAEAARLMRLAAHLRDPEGMQVSAWFIEQGIGG